MASDKILIVDDEKTMLDLYRAQLEGAFSVETAESGQEALALLESQGPYAVIVVDMHMPGISGAELLRRVQASHPQTVRIMLTGDDRQDVAVNAVNEGQVFRFLQKPCNTDRLDRALRAGVEQYRLVMAEKELLANTLKGSVDLLVEILSIINPTAFGRARRACRITQKLCDALAVENCWEITIAAMLSQVGCVTLPDAILQKLQHGAKLSPAEAKLYESHPRLGSDLVSKIPRLQRVAQIIALQQRPVDLAALARLDPESQEVATRAGFLKVALDFDELVEQGNAPRLALRIMSKRPRTYEDSVLRALVQSVDGAPVQSVRKISISELREGMFLEDNVVDTSGALLVSRGQEVTPYLLVRLWHRVAAGGMTIQEPISVSQVERPRPDENLVTSSKLASASALG